MVVPANAPEPRPGTRKPRAIFVDQGEKLRFLIDELGDRRPDHPSDPTRVQANADRPGEPPRWVERVTGQAQLAREVGADAAHVNQWCWDGRRVPDYVVPILRRIYRVDAVSFRTEPFPVFRQRFGDELSLASPISRAWRTLIADSPLRFIRITVERPSCAGSGRALRPRLRYAESRSRTGPEGPRIRQNEPFWIELESPLTRSGLVQWQGWHLLLFNRDYALNGFKCLVPANADPAEFGPALFPADTARLVLPRQPVLRHGERDEGAFELVAVLARAPAPEHLLRQLAGDDAHGLAIEPALDELAQWVAAAVTADAAVTARVRYTVERARLREAKVPP